MSLQQLLNFLSTSSWEGGIVPDDAWKFGRPQVNPFWKNDATDMVLVPVKTGRRFLVKGGGR